jgi:hypothetical protein
MCEANNDPGRTERLDERLDHTAEELFTGDSDDPPLSQEAIEEMLKITHLPNRFSL